MDFSIIIPHRDSLDSLQRLLDSIPVNDRIEVLVIDNSITPISERYIKTEHRLTLLYSDPVKFAGGARNKGVQCAIGKWLIFADADDFFTPEAFEIFQSHVDNVADLIYFKSQSVYDDTLEPSDRNSLFNSYIDDYLQGRIDELDTRLSYVVPWGKMVKRDLVMLHNIRFDEVLAANDVMFSTKCGLYAKHFEVDSREVYVITTRKGSLANRWDLPVVESRYHTAMRRNVFLKENGLGDRQGSVMFFIYKSLRFGPKVFCSFIHEAIRYHQNIFIGWRNWIVTFVATLRYEIKNRKYLTK